MATKQSAMEMPEVKRERMFECFVRTQLIDDQGYKEPVTNVDIEYWDPILSRDPKEYTEALVVALEHFHDDHDIKFRVWVETWIRD